MDILWAVLLLFSLLCVAAAIQAYTAKASPVERGDTVHHQQGKASIGHHGRSRQQQLRLVVCVVRTGVSNIVQHVRGVEPKPARAWQCARD